jgi:hypothetical protein
MDGQSRNPPQPAILAEAATGTAGRDPDQEVSRNEAKPQDRRRNGLFKAIKNMTIDGYYTSKIGIDQELQYKGNTYLKEFKGCTHPERQ